jgi:BirA family biotin operon repressor/biotin-[acetyl-CoA-carboxylase] ligase
MTRDDGISAGTSADGSPRWRISRFAELESTNHYALERAREGAATGLVVVADHQRAGRGRLDRTWEAPPGSSLLVSVVLHAPGGPHDAHEAVTAAAVALVRALAAVAGVAAGIKWPNDVLVGDRKLAGILAEREGDAVVVGLGVNVNWDVFPPELADIATAANLAAGRVVDRDALLDGFLAELADALDDPFATERAHRELLVTLGRTVRVELTGGGVLEGEAVGLGVHGELEVCDAAGVVHGVVAGDVVHLRPA